MRTRRVPFLIIAITTLALSGCTASAPAATATATGSSTAKPSETPTPETAAAAYTCDTVITEAGAADLASDNLTLREGGYLRPFAQFIVDADGLYCHWATSGDVSVQVATLPMTATEWAAKRSELLAEGFTEGDGTVAGYLEEPEDADDSTKAGFVYRDGAVVYVSYPGFAEFVTPLRG